MKYSKGMQFLDCGHQPSSHGDYATGTARTGDGREICWDCANKEEWGAMSRSDKYMAYLSGDGERVTTWPGGLLGRIWRKRDTSRFGNKMIHFQFHALDGSSWW